MSGAEEKKTLDLDMLEEEDDEFEEFPMDDWDIRKENQTKPTSRCGRTAGTM